MSKSIRDIKKQSKLRVNNHFGEAFIIVFVPFFIMNAITILMGQITLILPPNIEYYTDLVIQVFFNILATYMSFKLLIPFIRGENNLSFNNFFKLEKEFYNFGLLRIIVAVIFILIYLPVIPVFLEMITDISRMVDPYAIERYFETSDIVSRLAEATKLTSLLLFVFWLISIKFHMVPYIIIDQKVNLFKAFKISLKISKGNYFKILVFPFTYTLWILLLITFFGIFYVLPLIFVGYGYLYLSMIDDDQTDEDISFDETYKDLLV